MTVLVAAQLFVTAASCTFAAAVAPQLAQSFAEAGQEPPLAVRLAWAVAALGALGLFVAAGAGLAPSSRGARLRVMAAALTVSGLGFAVAALSSLAPLFLG
jgi:hypothetical protein